MADVNNGRGGEQRYVPPSHDNDNDTVTLDVEKLHRRLRVAWVNRKVLALAVVLGIAIGVLLAFGIPPKYEAKALLLPPDFNTMPSLGMLMTMKSAPSGGVGGALSDLLGMKTAGGLVVRALQTNTVENRLINRFDLKRVYGMSKMQKVRHKLEGRTDVDEDRKSGVITISVLDRDPNRAAQLANAYVEELDRLMREVNTSASIRERAFLEEQLNGAKADLDSASKELAEFASKNTTLDISVQGKAMVDAAARLQGQMIAIEAELRGLQQIYSDNSVRVQTLKAQIGELRRQLDVLHGKQGGALADTGDEGGDELYPSIRKLPLLSVTYMQLYRRAKIREVVFEVLTQQFELARLQEGRDVPKVQTLDPAVVPELVEFPPRTALLIVTPILFFIFGLMWVWAGEWWHHVPVGDARRRLLQPAVTAVSSRVPLLRVKMIEPEEERWAQEEHEEQQQRR